MSENLFPSGPWAGFYSYRPGDHHRMGLNLTFARGTVEGVGHDDVGPFTIRGRYDAQSCECHWTKTYLGAHEVFYRGFREGKGIWGTWEIEATNRGGFHIWPTALAGAAGEKETERAKPPVVPLTLSDRQLRTARPIRRTMGKPKPRGGRRSSTSSQPEE